MSKSNLNDYDLAEEAAASRKKHVEREIRLAVRRVFNKYNIAHHSGNGDPTARYRDVLKILGKRGGQKAARLKVQQQLTTPTEKHQPVYARGTLFEGHVSPPHRF